MTADRKAGWWTFDGVSAMLLFRGGNAHAFDPTKNATGDFTVMGEFSPNGVSGSGTVFSKWEATAGKRMWSLHQQDDSMQFLASGDGSTEIVLSNSAVLSSGTDAFFAARYDKSATGMYLDVDGAEVSQSTGPAAINSAETDVMIASNVSGDFLAGKIYWLAFWNKFLSSTDVADVRSGKHPCHLAPDFYIDFHQAVGTTYVSEIPYDVSKWAFGVAGTPVQGGSSEATLPDPIGEIAIMPTVPVGTVSFIPRPKQPKIGSQELGEVVLLDDTPITMKPALSAQRQNSRELGMASLLRFNRKRGR